LGFPGNELDRPLTSVKKAFGGALKRAGIRDFRFRDLMHTFASYLVMNGAHLLTVQELLGHKDIKTTMRYSHLSSDSARIAVRNLARIYHVIDTNMAQSEYHKNIENRKPAIYKDAPVAQADRAAVS